MTKVERRPDDNDPFNTEGVANEVARLHLQWNGMKAEIQVCHGELERLRIENDRLRTALESLIRDPPATLDEPDQDWEVIVKMRAIAYAALTTGQTAGKRTEK